MTTREPPKKPPSHVAIIMDGNGRWASARGLPRSAGHKAGIDALRRTIRSAADIGIEYLTIYSFSTENWSRPKAEVTFLLDLLRRFIQQDVAELHSNGVKIRIIGSREGLEPGLVKMLNDTESLTAGNSKLTLVVAFNYGARQEIADAARHLAQEVRDGRIDAAAITPEALTTALNTSGVPDPDLLIRTGGEQRLSNFLLWQSAYAELVFTDEFWPDFTGDSLARAIETFSARERRFGGLKAFTA